MSRQVTERLARNGARHPWLTIFAWIVIIAVMSYLAVRFLPSALTIENRFTTSTESQIVKDTIEKTFPKAGRIQEMVMIVSADKKVTDPAFKEFVIGLDDKIDGLGSKVVAGTMNYYETPSPALLGKDGVNGRSTFINVTMAGDEQAADEHIAKLHQAMDSARRGAAKNSGGSEFRVESLGTATFNRDFQSTSEKDLQTGEMYGMSAAMVILAAVFGTLVAVVVPVALALTAIAAAMGATAAVGQFHTWSFFVVNMITMMGLAVAVDYSLFIVSRFREELGRRAAENLARAAASDPAAVGGTTSAGAIPARSPKFTREEIIDAVGVAGRTAGAAVLFSGVIVIVSTCGLFAVPHTIFLSLAAGAVGVVAFSVLAALSLLPAILSLLGGRINSLKIPFAGKQSAPLEGNIESGGGFWGWLAKRVARRPAMTLAAGIAILLILAIPVASLETGSVFSPKDFGENSRSEKGTALFNQEFKSGERTLAEIVISGDLKSPEAGRALTAFSGSLKEKDLPITGSEESKDKDQLLMLIALPYEPSDPEARELVNELRKETVPDAFKESGLTVSVGGRTSEFMVDFPRVTRESAPAVFGVVLGFSFILLMLIFRSVVVPVQAIVINMLSVAAAYGVMIQVFVRGNGADFLGFRQVEVIEAWIPLFLFAILFGLSMDYHVFLLSRIKERFLEKGDNTDAVAFGLRSTGRVITGAALIMVAVFGGFAAGDLSMFQQMGFGLAVAILLDATLIRCLLVPAMMILFGRSNWYMPGWLKWLPSPGIGEEITAPQPAFAEADPESA